MNRPLIIGLAAVPAAALALAGAASGGVHAARATRHLSADPNGDFSFTRKRLSAPPGRVTLVMKNPSSSGLPHGIAIKGRKGKTVNPGGTSRVTVTLKRGTYTYYCPVPGHRSFGMKGRIRIG
jgi:uncharacterized cupredoxin-like copper-binding protein